MAYDFFVGRLQCPSCSAVAAADSATNMQTYLRGEDADLEELGIGHPVSVSPEAVEAANYWLIQQPQPGGVIQLLDSWTCPSCNRDGLWARITLRDGCIADVAAVPLDRGTLAGAHYISRWGEYVAADLLGCPPADLMGTDPVPILREKL